MDEDRKHDDGPGAQEDDGDTRREFLRRFASLSAAAVLLGVSAACRPTVVYGPDPEDVYGPPPVDENDPEAEDVYGPPPVDEN
jgi:hypothetical protein